MLERTPNIEILFQDDSGSTGVLTAHFPIGLSVAAALSAGSALGAAVASLTGCVLARIRIKYTMTRDVIITPDAGASITRRGVFIFSTTSTTPLALIELPGIKDSVFLSTGFGAGYIIDASESDVASFIASMLALPACNPFGDVATALSIGYLQSRV